MKADDHLKALDQLRSRVVDDIFARCAEMPPGSGGLRRVDLTRHRTLVDWDQFVTFANVAPDGGEYVEVADPVTGDAWAVKRECLHDWRVDVLIKVLAAIERAVEKANERKPG
jgi:hypothetical protein